MDFDVSSDDAPAVNPDLEDILGRPWCWREFGGDMMLVTETGGAKVVLLVAPSGKNKGKLMARGPDGVLRPVTEVSPIARVFTIIPELVKVALDSGSAEASAALAKAGLI